MTQNTTTQITVTEIEGDERQRRFGYNPANGMTVYETSNGFLLHEFLGGCMSGAHVLTQPADYEGNINVWVAKHFPTLAEAVEFVAQFAEFERIER